jgi:enoyl-CoA hydratase/carnithine racemase
MDKPLVLCDVSDGIAFLTLNHPEKRNALSRAMLTALKEQLARIAADAGARVVILRAEGPVFCSGHDLRELIGGTREDYEAIFALCTEVMEAIRTLPKPVIAEVQGIATAAGCQLAATCDLVVAAENAVFATPGVKIGLFCTTPAVALCRAIGAKKAMEMLLTGTPISAREAERAGLVNRVVPWDLLGEETLQLAWQILAASSYTVGLGKQAFYRQLSLDHAGAYAVAQPVMVENALAGDAQEGMKAFLEKRQPRWGQ